MIERFRVLDQMSNFEQSQQTFAFQLSELGSDHPDKSRANFYKGVYELLYVDEDIDIISLLSPIISTLPQREYQHFLNLLSHTHIAEYPFLIEKYRLHEGTLSQSSGKHYQEFSVQDWKLAIKTLLKMPSFMVRAENELREKRTQTFVLQRYLASQIILSHLFKKRPLSIVDGGCSLGIALDCMSSDAIGEYFQDFEDNVNLPSYGLTTSSSLMIDNQYRLDIEDLDEEWIFACSFYPSEAESGALKLQEILRTLQQRENKTSITELRGDRGNITQMDENIPLHSIDAIIVNTCLYQLSEAELEQFYDSAKNVLRDDGIIIITDFARLDHGVLKYGENWFSSKENKYRSYVIFNSEHGLLPPLEVFQFPNARCKKIYKGKDFHLLFSDR